MNKYRKTRKKRDSINEMLIIPPSILEQLGITFTVSDGEEPLQLLVSSCSSGDVQENISTDQTTITDSTPQIQRKQRNYNKKKIANVDEICKKTPKNPNVKTSAKEKRKHQRKKLVDKKSDPIKQIDSVKQEYINSNLSQNSNDIDEAYSSESENLTLADIAASAAISITKETTTSQLPAFSSFFSLVVGPEGEDNKFTPNDNGFNPKNTTVNKRIGTNTDSSNDSQAVAFTPTSDNERSEFIGDSLNKELMNSVENINETSAAEDIEISPLKFLDKDVEQYLNDHANIEATYDVGSEIAQSDNDLSAAVKHLDYSANFEYNHLYDFASLVINMENNVIRPNNPHTNNKEKNESLVSLNYQGENVQYTKPDKFPCPLTVGELSLNMCEEEETTPAQKENKESDAGNFFKKAIEKNRTDPIVKETVVSPTVSTRAFQHEINDSDTKPLAILKSLDHPPNEDLLSVDKVVSNVCYEDPTTDTAENTIVDNLIITSMECPGANTKSADINKEATASQNEIEEVNDSNQKQLAVTDLGHPSHTASLSIVKLFSNVCNEDSKTDTTVLVHDDKTKSDADNLILSYIKCPCSETNSADIMIKEPAVSQTGLTSAGQQEINISDQTLVSVLAYLEHPPETDLFSVEVGNVCSGDGNTDTGVLEHNKNIKSDTDNIISTLKESPGLDKCSNDVVVKETNNTSFCQQEINNSFQKNISPSYEEIACINKDHFTVIEPDDENISNNYLRQQNYMQELITKESKMHNNESFVYVIHNSQTWPNLQEQHTLPIILHDEYVSDTNSITGNFKCESELFQDSGPINSKDANQDVVSEELFQDKEIKVHIPDTSNSIALLSSGMYGDNNRNKFSYPKSSISTTSKEKYARKQIVRFRSLKLLKHYLSIAMKKKKELRLLKKIKKHPNKLRTTSNEHLHCLSTEQSFSHDYTNIQMEPFESTASVDLVHNIHFGKLNLYSLWLPEQALTETVFRFATGCKQLPPPKFTKILCKNYKSFPEKIGQSVNSSSSNPVETISVSSTITNLDISLVDRCIHEEKPVIKKSSPPPIQKLKEQSGFVKNITQHFQTEEIVYVFKKKENALCESVHINNSRQSDNENVINSQNIEESFLLNKENLLLPVHNLYFDEHGYQLMHDEACLDTSVDLVTSVTDSKSSKDPLFTEPSYEVTRVINQQFNTENNVNRANEKLSPQDISEICNFRSDVEVTNQLPIHNEHLQLYDALSAVDTNPNQELSQNSKAVAHIHDEVTNIHHHCDKEVSIKTTFELHHKNIEVSLEDKERTDDAFEEPVTYLDNLNNQEKGVIIDEIQLLKKFIKETDFQLNNIQFHSIPDVKVKCEQSIEAFLDQTLPTNTLSYHSNIENKFHSVNCKKSCEIVKQPKKTIASKYRLRGRAINKHYQPKKSLKPLCKSKSERRKKLNLLKSKTNRLCVSKITMKRKNTNTERTDQRQSLSKSVKLTRKNERTANSSTAHASFNMNESIDPTMCSPPKKRNRRGLSDISAKEDLTNPPEDLTNPPEDLTNPPEAGKAAKDGVLSFGSFKNKTDQEGSENVEDSITAEDKNSGKLKIAAEVAIKDRKKSGKSFRIDRKAQQNTSVVTDTRTKRRSGSNSNIKASINSEKINIIDESNPNAENLESDSTFETDLCYALTSESNASMIVTNSNNSKRSCRSKLKEKVQKPKSEVEESSPKISKEKNIHEKSKSKVINIKQNSPDSHISNNLERRRGRSSNISINMTSSNTKMERIDKSEELVDEGHSGLSNKSVRVGLQEGEYKRNSRSSQSNVVAKIGSESIYEVCKDTKKIRSKEPLEHNINKNRMQITAKKSSIEISLPDSDCPRKSYSSTEVSGTKSVPEKNSTTKNLMGYKIPKKSNRESLELLSNKNEVTSKYEEDSQGSTSYKNSQDTKNVEESLMNVSIELSEKKPPCADSGTAKKSKADNSESTSPSNKIIPEDFMVVAPQAGATKTKRGKSLSKKKDLTTKCVEVYQETVSVGSFENSSRKLRNTKKELIAKVPSKEFLGNTEEITLNYNNTAAKDTKKSVPQAAPTKKERGRQSSSKKISLFSQENKSVKSFEDSTGALHNANVGLNGEILAPDATDNIAESNSLESQNASEKNVPLKTSTKRKLGKQSSSKKSQEIKQVVSVEGSQEILNNTDTILTSEMSTVCTAEENSENIEESTSELNETSLKGSKDINIEHVEDSQENNSGAFAEHSQRECSIASIDQFGSIQIHSDVSNVDESLKKIDERTSQSNAAVLEEKKSVTQETPVKRKRGRPPKSSTTPKTNELNSSLTLLPELKKRRSEQKRVDDSTLQGDDSCLREDSILDRSDDKNHCRKKKCAFKHMFAAGKTVNCGVCKLHLVDESEWLKHAPEHNYIMWAEGEESVAKDVPATTRVLAAFHRHFQELQCKICRKQCASVLGFLSHIEKCSAQSSSDDDTALIKLQPKRKSLKCGVCAQIIDRVDWLKHIQNEHYYLAWVDGETAIDTSRPAENTRQLQYYLHKNRKLVCHCGEARASVVGFQSHVLNEHEVNISKVSNDSEDNDFVPSNFEVPKSGQVQCAVCSEEMASDLWKEHCHKKHYFLANFVGAELTVDLKDRALCQKILREYFAVYGRMTCNVCDSERLSSVGFYTHVLSCGRTHEDLENLKEKCSVCGEGVLPLFLARHVADCLARQRRRESHGKKVEDSGGKRRAALKAQETMVSLSKDDDDEKTSKRSRRKAKAENSGSEFEVEDQESDEDPEEYEEDQDENESEESDEESLADEEPQPGRQRKQYFYDEDLKLVEWNPEQRKKFEATVVEEYTKTQSSAPLFEDLVCKEYVPLNEEDVKQYMPPLKESCKAKVANSSDLKSYSLFESECSKDELSIFVGGPVTSMTWIPNDEASAQYLALSTKPYVNLEGLPWDSKTEEKTLIQFWKFENMNNKQTSAYKPPKLAMCLQFDHGPIWSMDSLPSGGRSYDGRRIGLLAVTAMNGSVYVYAICNPDSLQSDSPYYKTEPALEMKVYRGKNSKRENYPATAVGWSELKGHRLILVGYSDGTVATFDLNTKSPLLRKLENGQTVLYQSNENSTINNVVNSVCHLYEDTLAVGGVDGTFIFRKNRCIQHAAVPTSCASKSPGWPSLFFFSDSTSMYSYLLCPIRGIQRIVGLSGVGCSWRAGCLHSDVDGLFLSPMRHSMIRLSRKDRPISQVGVKPLKSDTPVREPPKTYEEFCEKFSLESFKRVQASILPDVNWSRHPFGERTHVAPCPGADCHVASAFNVGFIIVHTIDLSKKMYRHNRVV